MKESIWVTVTKTNGLIVAKMLAERLVAAEIPAQASQESVGRTFGFMGGALGTAYVLVPEQFLEDARALLDVEEPADANDLVDCPSCESELEIEEAEWMQGWFICPVCTARVMLEDLF